MKVAEELFKLYLGFELFERREVSSVSEGAYKLIDECLTLTGVISTLGTKLDYKRDWRLPRLQGWPELLSCRSPIRRR